MSNAITRTLLGLAHNLKLEVVAEGVEDHETWTMLATLDCDIVQAYCLSKSLPAAELATWLAHHHAESPSTTSERLHTNKLTPTSPDGHHRPSPPRIDAPAKHRTP